MTRLLHTLAIAGVCLAASSAYSQPQQQQQNANRDGTSLRGKVVRVEGQDRIVVRTSDNKEVTLMSTPTTRYVINGKAGRFADLQNGVNLNATYNLQDNRYIVSSIDIGDQPAAPGAGAPNDRRFRGRIVRTDAANNKVIARTQDGREVELYLGQNARFLRNGQVVKMADLPADVIIEAQYVERDNHWWVEEVTVVADQAGQPAQPPVPAPPATDGTQVQGTVVRVVGTNQVVIRTTDGKEVIIDVQPQTVYQINDQPAQLNAFQPGHDVRVFYNVRDRRNLASRILGNRR